MSMYFPQPFYSFAALFLSQFLVFSQIEEMDLIKSVIIDTRFLELHLISITTFCNFFCMHFLFNEWVMYASPE